MKSFKFYVQFCKILLLSQPKIPVTSCHLTVFSGVVYDALIVFQLFKNLLAFHGTSAYSVLKSACLEADVDFLTLTPRCSTLTLNCML
jgi:hypothetical protein